MNPTQSFKAGDWLVQEWKDGDVDTMCASRDGNFTDGRIYYNYRHRVKSKRNLYPIWDDVTKDDFTPCTLGDKRIKDFRLALPHEIPEHFRTLITEQNNNYSIF